MQVGSPGTGAGGHGISSAETLKDWFLAGVLTGPWALQCPVCYTWDSGAVFRDLSEAPGPGCGFADGAERTEPAALESQR